MYLSLLHEDKLMYQATDPTGRSGKPKSSSGPYEEPPDRKEDPEAHQQWVSPLAENVMY
jgi:hypothetical protein